eukprot:CAMPEP_0170475650 /NCGR_PEP_ID=MMETSP0123-20130129/17258_1 /TAXON_ID=182087 /ORGANISM="Favella ehrenbergii, Strain Fehren 1" /LENGTH=71 /DNA_ID=CAMNT_0010746287 /DNA_START=91 /DNA_END=306 /DNA_ORIENTATION=+
MIIKADQDVQAITKVSPKEDQTAESSKINAIQLQFVKRALEEKLEVKGRQISTKKQRSSSVTSNMQQYNSF